MMSSHSLDIGPSMDGSLPIKDPVTVETSVSVLEPLDVEDSLSLARKSDLQFSVTMLDPWYNKGVGGVRDDYVDYIVHLLELSASVSPHTFLWGFPEIVALFIPRLPQSLSLNCWLTWYYKNNPSVIRGWRSAQMTCLHLTREDAVLYPQHFLNEKQLQKQAEGKLRYMPGPTSVIENPLNIGFVRKNEQTGHPSQKPENVYEVLYRMTTTPSSLVLDPMCGAGTTGAVAYRLGFSCVLSDHNDEYIGLSERRLGIVRLSPDVVFGPGYDDVMHHAIT